MMRCLTTCRPHELLVAGGDAAKVMMSSPWLNPRVRKHLRQLVRKKTSEASGSRSAR